MPRGNPTPRNLAELVQAGGIDDAIDLRDRGYSGQRLREKLSSLYPSAFPQSVRALADRSILVRQAVQEVLLGSPQAEVYQFAIPLVEGAPRGVTATFESRYTPEGARVPIAVRVHVEDAGRMTVEELQEVGGEFLERSVSVSASAYPRLEAWFERQRRLAAAGDEEAKARVAAFRGRVEIGDIKLTAVMRGR